MNKFALLYNFPCRQSPTSHAVEPSTVDRQILCSPCRKMSSIMERKKKFMTSSNIHKNGYYQPTAWTAFPIKDSLVNRKGRHASCTPFVYVNGVVVFTKPMSFALVSASNCGWIRNSLIRNSFVYAESLPVLVSCSPTTRPKFAIWWWRRQWAAVNACVSDTDNKKRKKFT